MKKPAKKKSTKKMVTLKKPAGKKKHKLGQTQYLFRGYYFNQTGATWQSGTSLWPVVTDSFGTVLNNPANSPNGGYSFYPQVPAGTDKRVTLTIYQKDGGGLPLAIITGIDGNPTKQVQVVDVLLPNVP